ncbi:glycerophosphodiester phosphodiesterase family protein [Macrococcus sp. DPC7161]|uniref:glycerophosphodiester phosphodiesterase family protein n=1 Tax=Macrococcus sp. DPC7161 TaxID=2507060 RepID=UPI00100A7E92|nr:glycerophosphodiester phosphodiesterase family protein [Macrococcus sp. DPC7161]RXK19328.1 glycerophosphodiester phosphodiesterase [Macrococcus sp. DPC7161]
MTKIFAHRGYSKLYPENTMIAFKKALVFGAEGIELDVHMTKDHHIIIIHDDDLKRTTNISGKVNGMTLKEVQKAKIKRADQLFEQVPTINEFFKWVKPTSLFINVEIKGITEGVLEKKLIQLIHQYSLSDRIVISSFNENALEIIHQIDPEIETAYLFDSFKKMHHHKIKLNHVHGLHPNHRKLFTADLRKLMGDKTKLRLYTVNQKSKMIKYLKQGVDAIITDDVELAVKLKAMLKG